MAVTDEHRVNRSASLKVNLTPEMVDEVRKAASELGVSPSAWAAIRIGEAIRAQRKVGDVFESFGANLAKMVQEDEGADSDDSES